MNAYYFTASITVAQIRPVNVGGAIIEQPQVWSDCSSAVVCADSTEAAQTLFEQRLHAQSEGEHPRQTKIHEIYAAPLVVELLTETGPVPPDWPQITRQTWADVQSVPTDFMEQGYWLDQISIDNIQGTASNLDSFRQTMTEDLSSGLNWAEDKQFYFLFCVLSHAADSPQEPDESVVNESNVIEETDGTGLDDALDTEPYPKLLPMETAVLIRARNSTVAVWLWRKYAAGTPWRENPVSLVPWYGAIGVPVEPPPEGEA